MGSALESEDFTVVYCSVLSTASSSQSEDQQESTTDCSLDFLLGDKEEGTNNFCVIIHFTHEVK